MQNQRIFRCLEYSFEPEHDHVCHTYEYNFVYEVTADHLKTSINPQSPEKQIELVWVPISSLSQIDLRASALKDLIQQWLANDSVRSFSSDVV